MYSRTKKICFFALYVAVLGTFVFGLVEIPWVSAIHRGVGKTHHVTQLATTSAFRWSLGAGYAMFATTVLIVYVVALRSACVKKGVPTGSPRRAEATTFPTARQ